MTTELYNKGIKRAIEKINGLQFPFNEYDIVHDAILLYDGNDEAEFFKIINSMFYKNDKETTKFIPLHTATGEKKEETIADHITEDGELTLRKQHQDLGWRVCTKCHEPKPVGCFYVGMQYSRGKRFINPSCNECNRKQQNEIRLRNKKDMADPYIRSLLGKAMRKSGVHYTITHDDIEIRKTHLILNKISRALNNGIYMNRTTYKYKRG